MSQVESKQRIADDVNFTLNKLAIRGDVFSIENVLPFPSNQQQKVVAELVGRMSESNVELSRQRIKYDREDAEEAIGFIYAESNVLGIADLSEVPLVSQSSYLNWSDHVDVPVGPMNLGAYPVPVHVNSFRFYGDVTFAVCPKSYPPFTSMTYGATFQSNSSNYDWLVRFQNGEGLEPVHIVNLIQDFGNYYWAEVPIDINRLKLNVTKQVYLNQILSNNVGNVEMLFTKEAFNPQAIAPFYYKGFGWYRKNGISGVKQLEYTDPALGLPNTVTDLIADESKFVAVRYRFNLTHLSCWAVALDDNFNEVIIGDVIEIPLQGNTNVYILLKLTPLVSGLGQPEIYLGNQQTS